MIGGEEQNLNAGNSTDYDDKLFSDDAVDDLINIAINAGYLIDFSEMLQVD